MSKSTGDDYDYDDDFEEVDEEELPPVKAYSKEMTKTSIISNNTLVKESKDSKDSKESKESVKDTSSNNLSSRRVMKYGGSMVVDNNFTFDSRFKRIEKLKSLNILDLQEEKFANFTLLPSTKYDLYNRYLRSPQANIRQIGVPNEIEVREIETMTDNPDMIDKEMQFNYGDDTTLCNLIELIKNNKSSNITQNIRDVLNESSKLEKTTENETNEPINLSKFLHRTSYIIETLLDEPKNLNESNKFDDKNSSVENEREVQLSKGIFKDENNWKLFGSHSGEFVKGLIANRYVVLVKHSILQPNIVLSAYPPILTSNHEDSRSNKSFYCVWDINSETNPTYILESTGLPSACTFSSSQLNIVIIGTFEGCLYLWDLKEPLILHTDKYSKTSSAESTIRKPSYSTSLMMKYHETPIVQIESIHDSSTEASNTNISQFISLDSKGMFVFWITSLVDSSNNDIGCSPWSQVKLLSTRVIDTSKLSHTKHVNSYSCMSVIPSDLSNYLVADLNNVYKIARFGSITSPSCYSRSTNAKLDIHTNNTINDDIDNTIDTEISYHSYITCIHITSIQSHKLNLLLVGRSDGTIDLFNLNYSLPIYTWNLTDYEKNMNKNSKNKTITIPKNIGIIAVYWVPQRCSAFIAIDSNGLIYLFDLILDFYLPINITTVPLNNSYLSQYYNSLSIHPIIKMTPKSSYHQNMIDISMSRNNNKSIYLSMIDKINSIKSNKLKDEIIKLIDSNEVDKFVEILDHWIGRVYEIESSLSIDRK